jgi:PAS domain S-box-containing protein
MERTHDTRVDPAAVGPFAAAALGSLVLGVALALVEPRLVPFAVLVGAASVVQDRRQRTGAGLQIDQIERLRQAELTLANAASTEHAAGQLAKQAIALLGASAATVLIEGIGDTVRVSAGDRASSVYGPGSRMRLLDDAGVPCGSIAVSARADGRPYTPQQEHMLDALAQRVSSTLHRISLFNEVQSERATLADVVGSSSDGIFSVGPDLTVRSWNPAMERITGIRSEAALGNPDQAVFRPIDEEGRAPRHLPGEQRAAVVQLTRGDGSRRWLTCSWSPLAEGGYVCVARDETERKQLQDDKDGWIAQVSHELRTPLTPIKGFLHTLQRREDRLEAADRQRIYEVMLREEQRLENLVTALLQATTIDAGAVAVEPALVDWRDLVAGEVELLQRNDPERPILVALDPGVGPVVVDPALASGILASLLSNACKYSPPGSPIEVRAAVEGGELVTSVSDSGPGVDPEDRGRIFDKFTRLGDHLTRPQQGVGLGLYIARQSVEQLGGSITCDERPGGGARFTFRLPAPRALPSPPTSTERRRRRKAAATAR